MKNETAFSQLGRFAHVRPPFIAALESACEGRNPETVIQSLRNRDALLAKKVGKVLDDLEVMSDDSPVETDTPVIQPTTPDVPTSFTDGSLHYDLVSFLKVDDPLVSGDTMVARAVKLGAGLGEEEWDGRFILEYMGKIPAAPRDKIVVVFPGWHNFDDPRYIACLDWEGHRWCLYQGLALPSVE